MNQRQYERDGSYAARHDYGISPKYLLDAIVQGYEAMTMAIATGQSNCQSRRWAIDYLETGLRLLGYTEPASCVRTDFARSATLFAQNLRSRGR